MSRARTLTCPVCGESPVLPGHIPKEHGDQRDREIKPKEEPKDA